MATVIVGIAIECSSSTSGGIDEDCDILLSFKFPGMDKPVEIKVPVKKGQTAADISVSIAKAISDAVKAGKLTQEQANRIELRTHTAYGGTTTTASGAQVPLVDPLCMMVCEGVDSVDVSDTDHGKIKYFGVTGTREQGPDPPPAGGGVIPGPTTGGGKKPGGGTTEKEPTGGRGGTTVAPGPKPPDITVIDCAKYLEELKKRRKQQKKEGKSPDTVPFGWGSHGEDWFCDPRRAWRRIMANIMPPPGNPLIGHMLVGSIDIEAVVAYSALSGSSVPAMPGMLAVPFLMIADSLEDQIFEFHMRLAAAGVATQRRDDGVVVPTRFLRGGTSVPAGSPVRTVGIVTPYNPFGYGNLPWRFIVGEAADVGVHASLVRAQAGSSAAELGDAPLLPVAPFDDKSDLARSTGARTPRPLVAPQAALWNEWARRRQRDEP